MAEVLILLFLIFLNALFVMTEMALVSVRKGRLESLKNKVIEIGLGNLPTFRHWQASI
ncbi:MAG: DUF21 domain-containing protein [Sphingobacteriales bacterium]|nr:MAG: DUF21 domain-containing protein [Sphingobacteriales bacterium]